MSNEESPMENEHPKTQYGMGSDFLSAEEVLSLKKEMRQCWRMLGMMHLRMHNDMELRSRRKVSRQEVAHRLQAVSRQLDDMISVCCPSGKVE